MANKITTVIRDDRDQRVAHLHGSTASSEKRPRDIASIILLYGPRAPHRTAIVPSLLFMAETKQCRFTRFHDGWSSRPSLVGKHTSVCSQDGGLATTGHYYNHSWSTVVFRPPPPHMHEQIPAVQQPPEAGVRHIRRSRRLGVPVSNIFSGLLVVLLRVRVQ